MLRIVDRYLLLQFVQIFAICYVSLTGLFVVIDAFTNIDHFMTFARNEGQSLVQVLAEYYSYRAIAIFDQTSGVLALVAAMFTVTWIERYNELTALMAAGISRLRVLRPVIVAAIVVGVVAAANREVVMPQIRDHLVVDSRNIGGDQAEEIVSRYDSRSDILIDGDEAIVATQTIIRPNFILPSRLARYCKQIAADEARYVPAEGNRPSGYLLSGVKNPTDLRQKPSLSIDDTLVVVVTPHDAEWLAEDQLFVVSDVTFELLTGGAVLARICFHPRTGNRTPQPECRPGQRRSRRDSFPAIATDSRRHTIVPGPALDRFAQQPQPICGHRDGDRRGGAVLRGVAGLPVAGQLGMDSPHLGRLAAADHLLPRRGFSRGFAA